MRAPTFSLHQLNLNRTTTHSKGKNCRFSGEEGGKNLWFQTPPRKCFSEKKIRKTQCGSHDVVTHTAADFVEANSFQDCLRVLVRHPLHPRPIVEGKKVLKREKIARFDGRSKRKAGKLLER